MKLERISCPSCDANIPDALLEQKTIFCPYCGTQFAINDGIKRSEENINININEKITNDADIAKEYRKLKEAELHNINLKRYHIQMIAFMGIAILMIGIGLLGPMLLEHFNVSTGKIKVGQSSKDMKGENYRSVEQQLRSAGFANITTVDLDDAGWFMNKEDTVKSVTIGGDASFAETDYFDPSSVVVISYH